MSSKSKIDYLKKYLSSDKLKKSKKKNKDKELKKIKIIDDNEFSSKQLDPDEVLELAGEDAPQIVNMEEFKASEQTTRIGFVKSNWQNLSENSNHAKTSNDNNYSDDSNSKFEKQQLKSNKNKNLYTKHISSNDDCDLSPTRIPNKSKDSDLSPIRKKSSRFTDISPKRKSSPQSINNSKNSDSDLSPKRITRRTDSDLSPKRKTSSNTKNNLDLSPCRQKTSKKYNDDSSPPRRSRYSKNEDYKRRYERRSLSKSPVEHKSKRLGFQNSSMLRNENKNLNAQQDKMLQNLYDKSNNDEPNVRQNSRKDDKRLKHNPEKELENQKKMETYRKWGKGLKQIEDYKAKQIEESNTGNKPFARYSNDEDLDEMLKNTERDGDPMLEYIRKNKKNKEPNVLSVPIYNGPMPQNRFNIRPGYRWDGVDRSSGYEKKYFEVQNQRKAVQEEAYKYSVEDM